MRHGSDANAHEGASVIASALQRPGWREVAVEQRRVVTHRLGLLGALGGDAFGVTLIAASRLHSLN